MHLLGKRSRCGKVGRAYVIPWMYRMFLFGPSGSFSCSLLVNSANFHSSLHCYREEHRTPMAPGVGEAVGKECAFHWGWNVFLRITVLEWHIVETSSPMLDPMEAHGTIFFSVSVRNLSVAKPELSWVKREGKGFWENCDSDNVDQTWLELCDKRKCFPSSQRCSSGPGHPAASRSRA